MIILDVEGKCKGFFEKNRKKLKGGEQVGYNIKYMGFYIE